MAAWPGRGAQRNPTPPWQHNRQLIYYDRDAGDGESAAAVSGLLEKDRWQLALPSDELLNQVVRYSLFVLRYCCYCHSIIIAII